MRKKWQVTSLSEENIAMLALVNPTTVNSMIERQVSYIFGNYGVTRKEENIDKEDKEDT